MSSNEIFPNPTVKQVIFQIRFPNLFYMENKIGDLQLQIMEMFPVSALLQRQQVMYADVGPDTDLKDLPKNEDSIKKIWQFRNEENDVKLNLMTDSLSIDSTKHKSFKNPEADLSLRQVIEFVLDKFFKVTKIPILTRIGLRYIDECPVPELKNETFLEWYNSTFPLDRFSLENTEEMIFQTVVKKGEYNLRFVESLKIFENKPKLILDLDCSAKKVKSENCLNVTDELYNISHVEYYKVIKEPVIDYMRKEGKSD